MGFYVETPVGVGDKTRVLRSLEFRFSIVRFSPVKSNRRPSGVPASEMTLAALQGLRSDLVFA